MYNVVPVVRGIVNLLDQRVPPIAAASNVTPNPAETSNGDDDDDEDLLRPVFG